MKLYIDADSLLYRASHLACCKEDEALKEAEAIECDDDCEELGLEDIEETETMDAMKRIFHSMVDEIVVEVKDKHPEIEELIHVLTVKPKLPCCAGMQENFRYALMSSVKDEAVKGYKANRANVPVPEGVDDIYTYVYNLPNTICVSEVEADDVVVYYGRQGHIIAALDKDVLGSLLYAYNYGKKEWVEHTEEEVTKFPFIQTVMGDTSDGLRGIYRVGKKGAEKILADIDYRDTIGLWTAVVTGYYSKGQTLDEAVATMRAVRMDQWTEEDGLQLWIPPKRDTKIERKINER